MQHIEDARRDLVQFMQDSGKSQRQISKETGLSAYQDLRRRGADRNRTGRRSWI